jgi:uncharacterized LabA/DUF88 family protein
VAHHGDVLVVATHDGDFAPLFARLPGKVEKYVVGFSDRLSKDLREVATPLFIDEMDGVMK